MTDATCIRPQALLLAGSVRSARTSTLAQALGIPIAALPLDAHLNVLGHLLSCLFRDEFVTDVGIALADASERRLYERLVAECGFAARTRIWVDRQSHRGAGGTVRDYCEDHVDLAASAHGGLLVIECSSYSELDFAALLSDRDAHADASVVATRELTPAGIMHLSAAALQRIPLVGYFDLKEQLIPNLSKSGSSVLPLVGDFESRRITDLASYLSVLKARARCHAEMVSPEADVHASTLMQGTVLIGKGARIESDAFLSDCAVLPSATIGSRAVIARSVIPPGAHVPAGAHVIDEVFAGIATGHGGAS